jgi:4-hydroxy-tetrahydrodipicolinate synthase
MEAKVMEKEIRLEGIIPAMLTPFTENGEIDVDGIKENVNFLIENGVSGIMCNGSTGEAVALTKEERIKVIKATVEAAKGRVKTIAGTGVPSTDETIKLTRDAKSAGADAVMIITPFYEIPTQEGLYKHYETIAEAVDIPIVMYNIPQHTGVEIGLDVLRRLVEIDNIVALKDSSGNLSQFAEIIRLVGDKISVLTGCDDLLLSSFVLGSPGAILALCNIAPRLVVDLYRAVKDEKLKKAKELNYKLLSIGRAIGAPENFPAPVKEAVRILGRPAGPTRGPIIKVSEKEKEEIRAALKEAELL